MIWLRDSAELYLLLGRLTALTASAVRDLDYGQAAEDLLRAAWAYATVIDHKPLMARLRVQRSTVCFRGQPHRARLRRGRPALSAGRPDCRVPARQVRRGGGYRGSVQARELSDPVEQFCRETVVADLHSLPAADASTGVSARP